MGSSIILFVVIGWYMQDKKVNVAFLSIGVDYFQVLAIFARIKVRPKIKKKNKICSVIVVSLYTRYCNYR